MAKLYNLARMTTATTGTGTITLGSAVAGFLSFASSGIADGDTVTYAIEDGANSEIGRGVYTSSGTTLTRSVLKSTNSNAAISLSGSAQVFITPAAEDFSDPDNVASINGGQIGGFRNFFINGSFDVWERRTTFSGTTTSRVYAAPDRFGITSSGASLTSTARSTSVRTGARSQYCCEITGNTSVTTVDIDQRVQAANVRKTTVMFSTYVYNNTGGSFTPTLFVSTPSSLNNFTSTTVRNNGGSGDALQACADGAWTQVYWTADISGYTNIDNGVEFKLRIPSGSLNANTKKVRIAEWQGEEGSKISRFERRGKAVESAICASHFIHSWSSGTAVGTAFTAGSDQMKFSHATASFSTAFMLPSKMFSSSPTLTIYDAAGNSNKVSYFHGGTLTWTDNGTITSSGANDKWVFVQHVIGSSSFTNFAFTLESEL